MSSSLKYLDLNNFKLVNSNNKNILITDIPGISLILFYSPLCPYSRNFLPTFKNLPNILIGCIFGILNINENINEDVVQMSKSSNTPLETVPHLILYNNGEPFMIYKGGPHTEKNICDFVIEVTSKLPKNEKFSNNSNEDKNKRQIPEWSLGLPLYGKLDSSSYFTEKDAYNS